MVTKIYSLVSLGDKKKIGILIPLKFFLCLFTFSLIILIFYPLLFIPFTADDYFVLFYTRGSFNLSEFIKLFFPRSEVVYYRPLGIGVYFWLTKLLFGLKPLVFHLIGFIFHLLNVFLVYSLAKKITQGKSFGWLAAFLYGISAVHFLSLGWVVNFSYILGTFFYFLAFLSWLEKKYGLFFLAFILGLLSNEFLITLPLILLIYSWLLGTRNTKIFFCFLILLIYLILRFFVFKTISGGVYEISLNPKIWLNNYQWYFLWSFGWPETMKDQMRNLLVINPYSDFLEGFKKEFTIFYFGFWFNFLFLVILIIKNLWNKKIFIFKLLIFSLVWFLIGLLPVIFFQKHAYPHYSCVSLFGLVLFIDYLFSHLKRTIKKLFIFVFILIWFFISRIAVDLNMKVHWLIWHAQLSEKLINLAKKDYCPGKKQIIIKGDIFQNRLVLSGESAMKVVFKDDKIETVYQND